MAATTSDGVSLIRQLRRSSQANSYADEISGCAQVGCLVCITSSWPSSSSGTKPLPPHVGHCCSSSVPFSTTPSPLQSGQVFMCASWGCYQPPRLYPLALRRSRYRQIIRDSVRCRRVSSATKNRRQWRFPLTTVPLQRRRHMEWTAVSRPRSNVPLPCIVTSIIKSK
jgi:hypothetical protein